MSLKRVSYSDEGTVEKQPALTKVCKKFNPNGDEIMQSIPITHFFGLDKNRQADTLVCELYLKASNDNSKTDDDFIGEIIIPWKHTLENMNEF